MFWVTHERADEIFEAECRLNGLFLTESVVAGTTEAKMRSGIPVYPQEIDERDGLGLRLRWYCWTAGVLLSFTMNIDHDATQVVIGTPSSKAIGKEYPWQVLELLGSVPPPFLERVFWIRSRECDHESAVGLREDQHRILQVYLAESKREAESLATRLGQLFPGAEYVVIKPIVL